MEWKKLEKISPMRPRDQASRCAGKVFEICVEKSSELPIAIHLGNLALLSELGSSPATTQRQARYSYAYGSQPGCTAEQADGKQRTPKHSRKGPTPGSNSPKIDGRRNG